MKNDAFLAVLFALFPIYFLVLWTSVTFILSRSGWSSLASSFSTLTTPNGKTFRMASASINACKYNNCLTAIVTEEGLWLQPWVIFRMFHPPLLIPWGAFSPFEEEKFLWSRRFLTTVSTPEGRRVRLVLLPKALEIAVSQRIQATPNQYAPQPQNGPWSN